MHPAAVARAGAPTAAARTKLADDLRAQGVKDERVLAVIAKVPRHEFVEPAFQSQAYKTDLTVPIGHAQTLSQARVVATMTEALLAGGRPNKVLEIGTGSGYQTAVLAPLCASVFTVERIKALSETARKRLSAMGIKNVHFGYADGTEGWMSFAPYDAIVVTAGADAVPPALIEQLVMGGRLVIPIGPANAQVLKVITRTASGITTQNVANVSFVPLLAGKV